MNRVLIIAHAPLASALREAALHVLPEARDSVQALNVNAGATPEATLAAARSALARRAAEHGTLVLSDVLGATPCNVATRLLQEAAGPMRLLTGVNLPMLLRALSYRGEPLDVMAQRALVGGATGVLAVGTPPTDAAEPRGAA